MQTYLVVCANEEINAGERATAFDIIQSLQQQSDIKALLLKVAEHADPEALHHQPVTLFPCDRLKTLEDYADIPLATEEVTELALQQIDPDDHVTVIGAGHASLLLTALLVKRLRTISYHPVNAEWTTHMVNEAWQLRLLQQQKITLALPRYISRAALQTLDPAANGVVIRPLDGTPTGNSRASLEEDYQRFITHNPVGRELVRRDRPYVALLMTSGFEEKKGEPREVPPLEEFYAQGFALGQIMAAHEDLLIVHSGPRTIADEDHYQALNGKEAEMPTQAVIRGYRDAMRQRGIDEAFVLVDRFDPDAPIRTNGVNAMITCPPRCRLVFINDDGEGTKFDAMRFADLQRVFCFASSLYESEEQRLASRRHYDQAGITSVTTENLRDRLPPSA